MTKGERRFSFVTGCWLSRLLGATVGRWCWVGAISQRGRVSYVAGCLSWVAAAGLLVILISAGSTHAGVGDCCVCVNGATSFGTGNLCLSCDIICASSEGELCCASNIGICNLSICDTPTATPTSTPTNTPTPTPIVNAMVPTSSHTGLIVLAGVLAVVGVTALRSVDAFARWCAQSRVSNCGGCTRGVGPRFPPSLGVLPLFPIRAVFSLLNATASAKFVARRTGTPAPDPAAS